jgi:hypothetical protein
MRNTIAKVLQALRASKPGTDSRKARVTVYDSSEGTPVSTSVALPIDAARRLVAIKREQSRYLGCDRSHYVQLEVQS